MEQLLLVLGGTPATGDVELDAVVPGIPCGLAQDLEQSGVEVGHGRELVIDDRHAVRDLATRLAERTAVLTPECTLEGVDG